VAGAACVLALGAPAEARTVLVGETAPAGAVGPARATAVAQVETDAASAPYEMPFDGVVTRWWFQGGGATTRDDRVRLAIYRPQPDGSLGLVARSDEEAPIGGHPRASDARLAVRRGDVLGLRLDVLGDTPATWPGRPGDRLARLPASGEGYPTATEAGMRVNAQAQVETDADLDGLGDDSQDADDDGDGISDAAERVLRTSALDLDTDDDGLSDDAEEAGVTDPARADSDRDRLPDGLELGRTRGVGDPPGTARGTEGTRFRRDRDPRTRTHPRRRDFDRDGLADGVEDRNRDGRRQPGETDPRRRDTDADGIPDGRERRF
jgi:hypothetical protein